MRTVSNARPNIVTAEPANLVERIGRWLTRMGQKSQTLRYVVNVGMGGPTWSKNDILKYVEEAYSGNPYVYAALNAITQGMAEAPPILYRVPENGNIDKAFRAGYNLELSMNGMSRRPWSKQECARRYVKDVAGRISRVTGCHPALGRTLALKQLAATEELEEVTAHPVLDILSRPNGWYQTNFKEFVEAFGLSCLTAGEVFTEPVGTRGDMKAPSELYILPAGNLRAGTPMENNPIPKWHWNGYGRYGGTRGAWDYSPDPLETEMFFNKLYDPNNPLRGLSPVEAALKSIDLNNEARGYNLAFMRNAGVPPALITGEFNEIGAGAIEEAYEEQTSGGQKNAGRIATIGGKNLKFHQLSMDAAKLLWGETLKLTAREVSIVWGVPPEILGDSSNKTFANYREARQALYHERILPTTDFMYASWNSTWVRRFAAENETLVLDYDTSQMIALQEDMEKAYKRLSEANFLQINEKRNAVGYEDIPGGDVILVSLTQVPLSLLDEGDMQARSAYMKQVNAALAEFDIRMIDERM